LEEVWSSPEKLKDLQKSKSQIQDRVGSFDTAASKIQYIEESLSILDESGGEIFLEEIKTEIEAVKGYLKEVELTTTLSGETDRNNAIVTIHPGAGGVESQDWGQMLMRMYLRWAEKHGFASKIVDMQMGDEAGIKGVTFTVTGLFAYGYLKTEAGIHRLVRISPFDANSRRHTSFCAVFVFPEIEDAITVNIRDEDLRIDTFRASGAGGQHVNKVSSAVRITHIPSGIVVSCQSERSQHKNRETAMLILQSRLYDLERRERDKKIDAIVGDKKDISWGNQIRSYTLQPYRLVKDHRTGVEVGNVDAVLDGDIDIFIEACLRAGISQKALQV
jgi:peptide chain release factor 2